MKKVAEFFATITVPQAIVVVALIAAGVTLALLMPDERWSITVQILTGLLTTGGVSGTLFLNSRPSKMPPAASLPPVEISIPPPPAIPKPHPKSRKR